MKTDELERVFAGRGWLSLQPPRFRSQVIAMGRLVTLQRGAPAYHAGDQSGGVFGIAAGAMAVMGGANWQLPALAHIERAGDWFGHGPVLGGGARTLSFTATEPTVLLQVPVEQLRPRMASDPAFAARLAQMANVGTENVIWIVRDLLIPDSAQRLAAVLLRVTAMGEVPPADPQGYSITQAQLGEMANISRHQVNRIIGQLKQAGLIDVGYNRIKLLDMPRLKAFAYADR